jgi:hypothetical protein
VEPPKKGKGKAKASGGGGGGGSSEKKPRAAGSSGQASSSQQGSDQSSTPPSSSTAQAAGPALPPDAPATSGTQHIQLSKKEKEQQRKERQRQAKIDLAREMMDVAIAVMAESGVRCVSTLLPGRARCLGRTAY